MSLTLQDYLAFEREHGSVPTTSNGYKARPVVILIDGEPFTRLSPVHIERIRSTADLDGCCQFESGESYVIHDRKQLAAFKFQLFTQAEDFRMDRGRQYEANTLRAIVKRLEVGTVVSVAPEV